MFGTPALECFAVLPTSSAISPLLSGAPLLRTCPHTYLALRTRALFLLSIEHACAPCSWVLAPQPFIVPLLPSCTPSVYCLHPRFRCLRLNCLHPRRKRDTHPGRRHPPAYNQNGNPLPSPMMLRRAGVGLSDVIWLFVYGCGTNMSRLLPAS